MSETDQLLRILVQISARSAVSPDELRSRVVAGAVGSQIKAYNLCDGSRSQAEVARLAGVGSGNFSKTVRRWLSSGVVFRIGEGKDARLLHLYPLS